MKRKNLSLHVNPAGVESVATAGRAERGVYLCEIAAPGEVWYTIVLSSGKVGTIHLPTEVHDHADDAAILWRLLDERDPVPTLAIES